MLREEDVKRCRILRRIKGEEECVRRISKSESREAEY
jgi:hypothetical protein